MTQLGRTMTDMKEPDSTESEGIPRELQRALDREAVWVEPPADLQDNALAALRAARAAATPTPIAPTQTRPPMEPESEVGRPTGRRLGWLLSAAAAAVVAAVGTWTLVIDAPDSSLALAGTELAPAASAEVEITEKASGFEVVIDIEDLAPAAEGTYYQAWFKDADGVLVTIGTFHARESGQDIVLWSGVDPGDFDVLTVTLQRVGDGAESSGEVVLSGALD